jgi:hypothetical protein
MRTPTGCAHLGAQIFILNALSVLITFMMSSVWHAILDSFRPVSVWLCELALFYVISRSGLGLGSGLGLLTLTLTLPLPLTLTLTQP